MSKKLKCALVYDFDGTLAEGDCVEYGLMPSLRINDVQSFWDEAEARTKKDDGDNILAYLGLLAEKANQQNSADLSEASLMEYGKSIPLFPGVESWFDRINRYGAEHNLKICHYIISSGLEAMIRGTSIGKHFEKIYACKYHYSEDGLCAKWVAQAINYTTKMQFLFRINKGIDNSWDNEAINEFIEPTKREIPFERMIYFGDGDTDIPAMKTVKDQGGFPLAVFDNEKWQASAIQDKVGKLISEERANYVMPALYEEGSQLDVTVKGLLQLFKRKRGG